MFFLTFSVLLADFHLLSSLSPVPTCPLSTPPPTSSPAVTKIDDFHASSITGPEWVYLLSFMVIVFTEMLENAVCYLKSRLEPLTHGSKVIRCLPGFTPATSFFNLYISMESCTVYLSWACFWTHTAFLKRTPSKCNVDFAYFLMIFRREKKENSTVYIKIRHVFYTVKAH